jgi:hypothetical protein
VAPPPNGAEPEAPIASAIAANSGDQSMRLSQRGYRLAHAFFNGDVGGPALRDVAAIMTALVREGYARSRGIDIDAMNAG